MSLRPGLCIKPALLPGRGDSPSRMPVSILESVHVQLFVRVIDDAQAEMRSLRLAFAVKGFVDANDLQCLVFQRFADGSRLVCLDCLFAYTRH